MMVHTSGTKYTTGYSYTGTAGTDGIAKFKVPQDSNLTTLYYYSAQTSGLVMVALSQFHILKV